MLDFLCTFPSNYPATGYAKRECLVLVEVSKAYLGTTFEKTNLANSVLNLLIKTSNEPFVRFQLLLYTVLSTSSQKHCNNIHSLRERVMLPKSLVRHENKVFTLAGNIASYSWKYHLNQNLNRQNAIHKIADYSCQKRNLYEKFSIM